MPWGEVPGRVLGAGAAAPWGEARGGARPHTGAARGTGSGVGRCFLRSFCETRAASGKRARASCVSTETLEVDHVSCDAFGERGSTEGVRDRSGVLGDARGAGDTFGDARSAGDMLGDACVSETLGDMLGARSRASLGSVRRLRGLPTVCHAGVCTSSMANNSESSVSRAS